MFKKTLRGRDVRGNNFCLYCPPEGRLILLRRLSSGSWKFLFITSVSKAAFEDHPKTGRVCRDIPHASPLHALWAGSGREGKKNYRREICFFFFSFL